MKKEIYEMPHVTLEQINGEDVISTSIIMPPHYIGPKSGNNDDEQNTY